MIQKIQGENNGRTVTVTLNGFPAALHKDDQLKATILTDHGILELDQNEWYALYQVFQALVRLDERSA